MSRGTQRHNLADISPTAQRSGSGWVVGEGESIQLETKALCATPKERFRNHCKIRVIASREYPDNAHPRRGHLLQADSASFVPKHGAHVRLENNEQ